MNEVKVLAVVAVLAAGANVWVGASDNAPVCYGMAVILFGMAMLAGLEATR